MRFIHFILSHTVFIACCAAGLCFQTNLLLHLPHHPELYGFIFFSTLCSYNFYWLLSKFYFSDRHAHLVFLKENLSFLVVFFFAAAGTVFFMVRLPHLLPYVLIGMALTLVYSLPLWPFPFSKNLQKAGIFKTTLLSLTWAYVTTVLPAAGLPGEIIVPVTLLFSARFFFMLLLCIIFDMRDISVDKMHGLHSLATDVTKKKLSILIFIVFIFYIISGIFVRNYFGDDQQIIAFAVTGILVWLVYRLSLKPRGYIFYYFLVDGLMLLSALLSLIAGSL